MPYAKDHYHSNHKSIYNFYRKLYKKNQFNNHIFVLYLIRILFPGLVCLTCILIVFATCTCIPVHVGVLCTSCDVTSFRM